MAATEATIDRRADMLAFKKEVRSDIAAMRAIVEKAQIAAQKAHDETISSRASVNANSEHMIKLCDAITRQYTDIARVIDENTTITKANAIIAQRALELSEKTALENEGLFEFYQSGKKTADAVSRGAVNTWLLTLKASKTAKVLIPLVVLWGLLLAYWHGETVHVKDILEALR